MKKTLVSLSIIVIIVLIVIVMKNNNNEQQKNIQESVIKKDSEENLRINSLEADIQNIYPSDTKKQKIAYNFAKELEKILVVQNFDDLDLENYLIASDCMSLNMLGNDIGLIENLVFDTDEKMDKYINFNEYQSGKFFSGDIENLDCTFE